MAQPGSCGVRPGFSIVWVLVVWSMLCAMVSLGVDWGRVQAIRSQLYSVADAAARYGATGIPDSTYVSKAQQAARSNVVEGAALTLLSQDVELGRWDSSKRSFAAGVGNPNAIRVTTRYSVQTIFGKIIGLGTVNIAARSIATYTAGTNTTINVSGNACPWLAGMPNGTTDNWTTSWYDAAPTCSPTQVSGMNITPGAVLNFNFSGAVSYYPGTQPFDPDGDPGWIINNYYAGLNGGSEHGIADLKAPITSVIGVFLDEQQPDKSAAPESLDFSTAASRDFSSLSPKLKQPFFIGNGMRANGITPQNFVVPAGATRLFIGVMDGQQWSDNSGSLTTVIVKPPIISTVR